MRFLLPFIGHILHHAVDDEVQQSTALVWLAEFVDFAPEVMVPFAPRLIPAMLPNLAHHVMMIQDAAKLTNERLFNVIRSLPVAQEGTASASAASVKSGEKIPTAKFPRSPTPTLSGPSGRQSSLGNLIRENVPPDLVQNGETPQRSRSGTVVDSSATPRPAQISEVATANQDGSRSHSPSASVHSQAGATLVSSQTQQDDNTAAADPFDYQTMVTELTVQFLSEFEETRVTALKWLIMLHQKVPKKVRL